MATPPESPASSEAPRTVHAEEYVAPAARGRATWDQGSWKPRFDLGLTISALGLALVLWGVGTILGAAYGPERTRTFAERRSYNQVKPDVHAAMPLAMTRALCGVLTVAYGLRLRRKRASADE